MLSRRRSDGEQDVPAGWSTGEVRGFVALLVVLQVLQGVFDRVPKGNVQFTETYYLVTYHHGFIRRGLLGDIINDGIQAYRARRPSRYWTNAE